MTLADRLNFIDQVVPFAVQSLLDYGIPASATIAQAILETNWGRKAPGNNYFGIKATTRRAREILKLLESGAVKPDNLPEDVQIFGTHEEDPAGRVYAIHDVFRRYHGPAACFRDRERILMGERYKPAMQVAADTREFCRQVQRCGWATASRYGDSLIALIDKYSLEKYDTITEVQHE